MADTSQSPKATSMASTERLSKIRRLFEEIKDGLFECALELTRENNADWQKAEELFKLAKNTDTLRLSLVALIEGDNPESERTNERLLSVVTSPQHHREDHKTAAARALKTGRKKKSEYPKYSVRGDSLIKTGLSRDRRNEYEHIVPHKEFERITGRLVELSKSKRNFSVEDVQEALDCPNYQTYVVLALMKDKGLLTVPRRGLYSFKGAKTFASDAATIWTELKKR